MYFPSALSEGSTPLDHEKAPFELINSIIPFVFITCNTAGINKWICVIYEIHQPLLLSAKVTQKHF